MKNDHFNPIGAFNRIYSQYYKAVVSYFSKRYNSSEAEDLAQITFMKLWDYIPACAFIKNEKSLIFKIAKNVLIDKKRQQKFYESLESVKEQAWDADFSGIEIQSVIAELDARDREIIALKNAGFSSREIAKIQGTAPSTVRSRLQVIKSKLKNNII